MRRLKGLVPPVVLIALPLVLYAPFLFGGQVLYWGVYLLQFHPWRQLAAEQLRTGHWPLWNPTLGAGTPLAANLQTVLGRIKKHYASLPDIRNVLLYLYDGKVGEPPFQADEEGFELVCIDYSEAASGNFVRIEM